MKGRIILAMIATIAILHIIGFVIYKKHYCSRAINVDPMVQGPVVVPFDNITDIILAGFFYPERWIDIKIFGESYMFT